MKEIGRLRVRLCFVCLGNICRSPTAEGIMLQLVHEAGLEDRIEVASAGTEGYHVGERADARSRREAASRGVELPSRARQFVRSDFDRFDYVLAMDSDNLAELRNLAKKADSGARLCLLREFDPDEPDDLDVPDPYYGGEGGFARVFDICEASCREFLRQIAKRHELGA